MSLGSHDSVNLILEMGNNYPDFTYEERWTFEELLPGYLVFCDRYALQTPMTVRDCVLKDIGHALYAISSYWSCYSLEGISTIMELKLFLGLTLNGYKRQKRKEFAARNPDLSITTEQLADADFDQYDDQIDMPKLHELEILYKLSQDMAAVVTSGGSMSSAYDMFAAVLWDFYLQMSEEIIKRQGEIELGDSTLQAALSEQYQFLLKYYDSQKENFRTSGVVKSEKIFNIVF